MKKTINKLFGNKNTIIILSVGLGIFILYFLYNSKLDSELRLQSVPVASYTIQHETKITSNMISSMQVPQIIANRNSFYRAPGNIIGLCTKSQTIVPVGSFFYFNSLVPCDEIEKGLGPKINKINPEYDVFTAPINIFNSYGNSFFPGNYVDIYLKAYDRLGRLQFGKLFKNVVIADITDDSNNSVFESTLTYNNPNKIHVALSNEDVILLEKAKRLNTVEIIFIPTNEGEKENPSDYKIASSALKQYIEELTKSINITD